MRKIRKMFHILCRKTAFLPNWIHFIKRISISRSMSNFTEWMHVYLYNILYRGTVDGTPTTCRSCDDVTAMTAIGNSAATVAAADDGFRITYVTELDAGTFGTVYRAVLFGGGDGSGSSRAVAVRLSIVGRPRPSRTGRAQAAAAPERRPTDVLLLFR